MNCRWHLCTGWTMQISTIEKSTFPSAKHVTCMSSHSQAGPCLCCATTAGKRMIMQDHAGHVLQLIMDIINYTMYYQRGRRKAGRLEFGHFWVQHWLSIAETKCTYWNWQGWHLNYCSTLSLCSTNTCSWEILSSPSKYSWDVLLLSVWKCKKCLTLRMSWGVLKVSDRMQRKLSHILMDLLQ